MICIEEKIFDQCCIIIITIEFKLMIIMINNINYHWYSIVKNKMKQPVFVLVALFMLSSCGLKKPLWLPQENASMINSIHHIPSEL